MTTVLALDPGYGNTKVCVDGHVACLQSAIARPQSVGMAAIGMKTASQVDIICLNGQEFAIGPGTWHWGSLLSGRDYSALASLERRALAFGTLATLLQSGDYVMDQMVIGLPVPLLKDTLQAKAVLDELKAYKDAHHFAFNGQGYNLVIQRLKVLAQPVGAYTDWLLDDDLNVRKGGRQAEVGVLDLGMNTLDLYVIQDGKVEPRFVGGDKVGVRSLLELLTANGHDPEELDADLRSGRLRVPPVQMKSWLGKVLNSVDRTWPNLTRFDAVIPTGGGALVLGDLLRLALIAKGAAVCWPADPVAANVKGLWKWGAYGG
jgi:hypothetical protein